MSKDNSISKLKKISAILRHKCPACHEGEFYLSNNPYNFRDLGKYYDNCKNCGQRFSLEPGFYFGAAYISYALNVALFVIVILIIKTFFTEATLTNYISGIIIFTLILAPIIYRLSRVIWASIFIPYGGEKKK